MISKMTAFDPTIKEKYHEYYGEWMYSYTESPLVSVLTWAANPFEHGDLAASQQYTNFWKMIGYENFVYVPTTDMILQARKIRVDNKMVGYPKDGYILDLGNMIIVSLSDE